MSSLIKKIVRPIASTVTKHTNAKPTTHEDDVTPQRRIFNPLHIRLSVRTRPDCQPPTATQKPTGMARMRNLRAMASSAQRGIFTKKRQDNRYQKQKQLSQWTKRPSQMVSGYIYNNNNRIAREISKKRSIRDSNVMYSIESSFGIDEFPSFHTIMTTTTNTSIVLMSGNHSANKTPSNVRRSKRPDAISRHCQLPPSIVTHLGAASGRTERDCENRSPSIICRLQIEIDEGELEYSGYFDNWVEFRTTDTGVYFECLDMIGSCEFAESLMSTQCTAFSPVLSGNSSTRKSNFSDKNDSQEMGCLSDSGGISAAATVDTLLDSICVS